MSNLKPCPFCGGKAELKRSRFDRSVEGFAQAEVSCTKCGVYVVGKGFDFYNVKYDEDNPQHNQSAIDVWNTRYYKE
jgi:Lar family restriction alleviation protein